MRILVFAIGLLGVFSLNQSRQVSDSSLKVPFVEFCDLPKFVGDTVRIKVNYSGFVEYWSMKNPDCPDLKVDLEDPDYDKVPSWMKRKYRRVHDNLDMSLDLELIGVFDNTRSGYGHLGSNNAGFKVIKYIKAKPVRSD